MRSLSIRIIVALLAFLLGIAAATLWVVNSPPKQNLSGKNDAAFINQEKQELRLEIPDDGWVSIFFESINKRANIAKLSSLRTALPKDDLEVRVWGGFGLTPLEGFILKRTDGQWSAIHLKGISKKLPPSEYQKNMEAPKSGWESCWQRLVDAGILTLPDASEVKKCEVLAFDGFSYVVEINMNNTYRTYMYDNPIYAKCDEAKQMLKIGKIIDEEFGLRSFSLSN
ncbi:MAG TPA: hypothetical protein VKB86_11695 [Pyrinomonadaceae bacterium]|nr:hypothetical protein [Pyrinomonadaceae bacterium]